MKNFLIKNKNILTYLLLITLISLVFTVLEYIGLSFKISSIIISLINFILIFIFSFNNAKKDSIEGFKSGFRSGVKIWAILLIYNLITFNNFTFKLLIYYFIILFISIAAGIFGKNKQKKSS